MNANELRRYILDVLATDNPINEKVDALLWKIGGLEAEAREAGEAHGAVKDTNVTSNQRSADELPDNAMSKELPEEVKNYLMYFHDAEGGLIVFEEDYQEFENKLAHELALAEERGRKKEREQYDFPDDEEIEQMEEKNLANWNALLRGESVYISERGNVISEEEYFDFEDYASTVGLPEGSKVERFIEVRKFEALTSEKDNHEL